jgi:phosphoglucomutase
MQAGTAFMNSLVILQATQGLARYACRAQSNARERGVVVGHDHRHRSKLFAQLAAGVFRREGMKVWLLDGLVHTPMIVSRSTGVMDDALMRWCSRSR